MPALVTMMPLLSKPEDTEEKSGCSGVWPGSTTETHERMVTGQILGLKNSDEDHGIKKATHLSPRQHYPFY